MFLKKRKKNFYNLGKIILVFHFFLLICNNVYATSTIDGYVFLEGQIDHSNIQVFFERIAPSSLTMSTTTKSDGSFSVQIEEGIYNVTFSKEEYISKRCLNNHYT